MTFTMILFLIAFFATYIAIHCYLSWRFKSFGAVKWIKWVVLFLAISFPIATWLSRNYYNLFVRVYYTVAFTWLGVMFYFLCSFLLYEIARRFIKLEMKTWRLMVYSLAIALSLVAIINGQTVRVKEIDLVLPNLQQELRLVQLSDVHVGTTHNSIFLTNIIKKVNALNPDIVVITGDFFDGSGFLREHTVEALNLLEAPSYLTVGNHENYEGLEEVAELMTQTNTILLEDEKIEFKDLQIVASNFPLREGDLSPPDFTNIELDDERASILLYHQPTGMEEAAAKGIDLQLSGHTHAGQIFPFNFVVKLWYPYSHGLYDFDEMKLYVSPGTGTWGPAMRLGSRNEITLFNLK